VHEKTRGKGAGPATGEVVLGVRALVNGDTPSVEVTVRDSGAGVRPGDIARVFEPHFTTKAGGTGLGLAIVQRAVDAHRGKLFPVESKPGVGTTFTIYIPARFNPEEVG
jgi:signal transduction histidine kinase